MESPTLPRMSTWQKARHGFYGSTLIALCVVGLWLRFTNRGLELLFRFVLNVPLTGNYTEAENAFARALFIAMAGYMGYGVMMLLVFSRYKRHPPLGAIWLWAVVPIAVVYGDAWLIRVHG